MSVVPFPAVHRALGAPPSQERDVSALPFVTARRRVVPSLAALVGALALLLASWLGRETLQLVNLAEVEFAVHQFADTSENGVRTFCQCHCRVHCGGNGFGNVVDLLGVLVCQRGSDDYVISAADPDSPDRFQSSLHLTLFLNDFPEDLSGFTHEGSFPDSSLHRNRESYTILT